MVHVVGRIERRSAREEQVVVDLERVDRGPLRRGRAVRRPSTTRPPNPATVVFAADRSRSRTRRYPSLGVARVPRPDEATTAARTRNVPVVTETTVFEVVGGQPFFDALVERFYEHVEADADAPSALPGRSRARHAVAGALPRPVLGRTADLQRGEGPPAAADAARAVRDRRRRARRLARGDARRRSTRRTRPRSPRPMMREYFDDGVDRDDQPSEGWLMSRATATARAGPSGPARQGQNWCGDEQAPGEGEAGPASDRVGPRGSTADTPPAGPRRPALAGSAGARRRSRVRRTRPTHPRSCPRSRPTSSPTACAPRVTPDARSCSSCADAVKVGMTTDELDRICHEACIARGGYPSPLHYKGFPKSLCTSVNEVICHGIPDDRHAARRRHRQLRRHDLSCTVCTATATRRSSSATSTTNGTAPRAGHARSVVEGHRPGAPRRAAVRGRPRDPDARRSRGLRRWCARSSATGSARSSTPRPRSCTTTTRSADLVLTPGLTFTIEPMINEGRGSSAASGPTAGPRRHATARVPRSSSTACSSRPTGVEVCTLLPGEAAGN